jgi:phospholipid/cholesterol/gamma-HCH transport system substrate-binding protein
MKEAKAVKVGIFLVVGLLLFAAGLFLIGNHNQVFASHYTIYTQFTNLDTLVSGAKVRVSGMDAGQVSGIGIPKQPGAQFRLKLDVDKKFRNVIRQDSVASIETEGMVGNKFVNIALGQSQSAECRGCTLPSQEPFELSDLMKQGKNLVQTVQGTIQDVQHHADTAIDNFSNVGQHADGMILAMRGNVERIASNGAQISSGVNSIVTGVRDGHGTVGKLLTDQQMAKNVDATIANAKLTSANIKQASENAQDIVAQFHNANIPQEVQQTVANARDTTQQIKSAVGNFLTGGPPNQNTAQELRQTVVNAQRATRNLASDTEAIKHNFFLRGFFHRRGYYNLTYFNRTEYDSSKFVKKPAKRVWLRADGMFRTTPDGSEELTSEGQNEIDRALSQVADYLPNNPVMVEGYSETGSSAERYLTAMQRATDVKQYLESRFELKPSLIGTIPLDDKPPVGAGPETWNGVCLALVLSRD